MPATGHQVQRHPQPRPAFPIQFWGFLNQCHIHRSQRRLLTAKAGGRHNCVRSPCCPRSPCRSCCHSTLEYRHCCRCRSFELPCPTSHSDTSLAVSTSCFSMKPILLPIDVDDDDAMHGRCVLLFDPQGRWQRASARHLRGQSRLSP